MERLIVSVVAEINQLMCEYCAVLQELSREKQQHPPINDFNQEPQDTLIDPPLYTAVPSFPCTPSNHSSCTFITCSQVGECPQYLNAAEQSSQFCSEPPEVSEDPCTDYKQCVERQYLSSISPVRGYLTDVGCHIKREAESPGLYTPGEMIDQGFEFQMYTDSGAFPPGNTLPDTPVLTCYSSSLLSGNQKASRTLDKCDLSSHGQLTADGDTSSYQGNQFENQGRGSDNAALRAGRATGRSRYMCDYCGKGFPFLSMMKGYQFTHTGERTQVCGQCGMSFIRRSHLRCHEMLQSGIRPFTCQICGRKFSCSTHLSTLMKTHCSGTSDRQAERGAALQVDKLRLVGNSSALETK
ncbi:zinc finger protein 316-like protein [Lates japonicus]|uniref:Zinc finger protein 316-like protein n=1 Tax=Lates japonicus TaxID=270547 RepID=A0AAD3RAC7_LATJO|nr:zinc finger protein 316-like protein [Lates japonicus]